ncbi:retrotransposon protein, putative, ty1-copia subclass [Tanacetum coccineum]
MFNLTTLPLSLLDYALESAVVWGCEAYVKRDSADKLKQRSVKCIFVGYPKETMGYYFYFPPENKVIVAVWRFFLKEIIISQEIHGRDLSEEYERLFFSYGGNPVQKLMLQVDGREKQTTICDRMRTICSNWLRSEAEWMQFGLGRIIRDANPNLECITSIKTDFPTGVSPKVGHFMILYPETSGVEKVKLKEDAPKGMFSSENIVAENLPISENIVTATKDELRETQKKEQMLAEQDIKMEQVTDQRNTRGYFLYNPHNKLADETTKGQASCENYGVFDNIFGERKKNKAPYTEPVLAEQDIKVEQTKETRHYHGKLSVTPENSEEDENARTQATKPLITCISDYRLIADSLPLIQKEEVNNECVKAEQWLNDHSQQHSSPNKVDPVHWSSIIKYSVEAFERRCEHIMRSKPSSEKDIPNGMQVD